MKNLIIIISLIGAEVAVAKDLSKNLRAVETLEKEIVSEEVVCRADGRLTFNGTCDACCSKSCVRLQNWFPKSWKKCQSDASATPADSTEAAVPGDGPTLSPTLAPTLSPTLSPTLAPTLAPTLSPIDAANEMAANGMRPTVDSPEFTTE